MSLLLSISITLLGVILGLSGYPLTGFILGVAGVAQYYLHEPIKKLLKK